VLLVKTVKFLRRPRVIPFGDGSSTNSLGFSIFGGETKLFLQSRGLGRLGELSLKGGVLGGDSSEMAFEFGGSFSFEFGDLGGVSSFQRGDLGSVEGCFLNGGLSNALCFGELLG